MKGSRGSIFTAFKLLSVGWLLAVFPLCLQAQAPDKDQVIAAWEESGVPGRLTITYPRENTLFPAEIIPPTIKWKDESERSDTWLLLAVRGGKVEVSEFAGDGEIKPPRNRGRRSSEYRGKNRSSSWFSVWNGPARMLLFPAGK